MAIIWDKKSYSNERTKLQIPILTAKEPNSSNKTTKVRLTLTSETTNAHKPLKRWWFWNQSNVIPFSLSNITSNAFLSFHFCSLLSTITSISINDEKRERERERERERANGFKMCKIGLDVHLFNNTFKTWIEWEMEYIWELYHFIKV